MQFVEGCEINLSRSLLVKDSLQAPGDFVLLEILRAALGDANTRVRCAADRRLTPFKDSDLNHRLRPDLVRGKSAQSAGMQVVLLLIRESLAHYQYVLRKLVRTAPGSCRRGCLCYRRC